MIALYREGLCLFLYGYVKDMDWAEDLMIEAFAKMMVKGGGFRGDASLKTYLYAIARNLALRHLKKYGREKRIPWEGIATAPDGEPARSPEMRALREEDRRTLYEAMQRLKREYREALHLLYFEDMSYAEAGAVMGKSPRQIADLAYRGKLSLKAKLEQLGIRGYGA